MSEYVSFRNNGTFFIAVIINSAVCFSLFGIVGCMFGVLTTLFSSIVYDAKNDSSNIFYMTFLLLLVMVGGGDWFSTEINHLFLYLFISCIILLLSFL